MIALGCDHGGFELMQEVKKYLEEHDLEYRDYGTYSTESCDYPIYSQRVARAIQSGTCDRGVLICGTGLGITVAANRFRGIRAAVCANEYMAQMAREHNNANILGLGARVLGVGTALSVLETFLNTPFSEGDRHKRRIAMIEEDLSDE